MESARDVLFTAICRNGKSLFSRNNLFLNARYHPYLDMFEKDKILLQQYFKPYARMLHDKGYNSRSLCFDCTGNFENVFILLPKNAIEARFIIAAGIDSLQEGGRVFCAASNNSGGRRIKKMLQDFGISDLRQESANHVKLVSGIARDIDSQKLMAAKKAGSERPILDNKYVSIPGVFSWDRIDKGSEILTSYLPDNLFGKCADFGCGYGYLSDYVLSNSADISAIFCLDADFRALELCKKNISRFNVKKYFLWEDLRNCSNNLLSNLDYIVMNPPFHEGKKTDISLGKACIEAAARALKPGASLFMVANCGLPYEKIIAEEFSQYNSLFEGDGYKIYHAQR